MNSQFCFFTLVVLCGSLALTGCGESKNDKKPDQPTIATRFVTLSQKSMADLGLALSGATMKPLSGTLTAPAKVISNQDLESQVGSLVQGRVRRVYVKVGDFVSAGQTLMTVEGLDVGSIKAGFLKAKASHDYAKANYERQKKLLDDNVGSQKALLESQAEYEKALAEYSAEDKRIHSVGLYHEDMTNGKGDKEHTSGTLPIKSHIDGVVVERNVIVGQFVDATTNAFKVINTTSVWVDGQIYEKDLSKIRQKTDATFTTTTYPDKTFLGRIIYIGQTVDEQSRTITVRGEFSNPGGSLKPQMFGELNIPVGSNGKALMVPDEAVVREAGQSYVFVRINDTTFEKRTVSTGTTVNEMVEIKGGLEDGTLVASKGVFYLKSELKKDELAGD